MEICSKCQNRPKRAQPVFVGDRCSSNRRNRIGETALHSYAKYVLRPLRKDNDDRIIYDFPKAALVSYAISCGCEVDAKDHLGRTALMVAVTVTEEVLMIDRLLSENADIYTTDFEGVSALRMVIDKSRMWLASLKPAQSHLLILSLFFEKVNNDFHIDKTLALQRLQSVGCPKALVPFIKSTQVKKYLFSSSVALEERLSGLTALHVAAMAQDIISVKILIALGENINGVDCRKQTALFAHDPLAKGGTERFGILETLLNRGASLYKARNDGVTPMEYLLKYGKERTIQMVLESNANIFKQCEPNGETALHFLVQNENLGKSLPQMMRLLLRRGFNMNTPDNNGISALTYAIKHELEQKIEYLLKVGAKANWIEIIENTSMLDIFMNVYYEKGKAVYYQWVVQLIFLQQGINVRHLFDELNKGFIRKLDNLFYGQIVIAHLVIAEATGQRVPDSTLEYIESEIIFRVHYEICKERIEEIKAITVYDTLTLYQLLTETDDFIDRYICNQDFLAEFKYLTTEKSYQNLYYFVIVRKRIENAIKIMELRKKGGRIVSECTGLNVYGINKDHYVTHKIVSYLTNRDVQNLFSGQSLSKSIPMPPPRTPKVRRNILSRAIRTFFARTDER